MYIKKYLWHKIERKKWNSAFCITSTLCMCRPHIVPYVAFKFIKWTAGLSVLHFKSPTELRSESSVHHKTVTVTGPQRNSYSFHSSLHGFPKYLDNLDTLWPTYSVDGWCRKQVCVLERIYIGEIFGTSIFPTAHL